jgi:hypothetical protein
MAEVPTLQTDYGSDDPVWIDNAWLDTVVVIGLTMFVLCLMNLNKVSPFERMIWKTRNNKSTYYKAPFFFRFSCRQLTITGLDLQNGNALWNYWNDVSHCWILGR